jgi:hypothetical protein
MVPVKMTGTKVLVSVKILCPPCDYTVVNESLEGRIINYVPVKPLKNSRVIQLSQEYKGLLWRGLQYWALPLPTGLLMQSLASGEGDMRGQKRFALPVLFCENIEPPFNRAFMK